MHREKLIKNLEKIALSLRIKALEMINAAHSGHIGGSLSCAEIITALYFHHLRIDPRKPAWEDRDRFICSKGHAAPLLYAALALRGYFPKEWLVTLRQIGSRLQGHPDMNKTPGIDMTSGSLGQGLSAGIGMALGARLLRKNFRTYVLMGDGELNEGQVWETLMAAAHYKLNNIVALVDRNKVQLDGFTEEIMSLEPLVDKIKAFGWEVKTADGHCLEKVLDVLDEVLETKTRPVLVIFNTTKGKGVSFMENRCQWHGKNPSREEYESALKELTEKDGT